MPNDPIHIVKLGGSLLDLPDLAARLSAVREARLDGNALLVVGGGASADVVRLINKHATLDESAAHWLCIRAMQLNAMLVQAVLPRSRMVKDRDNCDAAWGDGELAVMDPLPWLRRDEAAGRGVPHRWTFTSDSIAAHVATQLGAVKLTLLKSTLPTTDCGVGCAAGLGIVDDDFEQACRGVPAIDVINLRHDPPTAPAALRTLR